LQGQGACVEILGIIALSGLPALRCTIEVVHEAQSAKSNVTIVSVLKGNAAQEVKGKIMMKKGAKGADGFLSHRTLTLSKDAKSISEPILEIEEDDVKAAHEGVSGPVDPEQLFYLQSRGLSLEQGEKVIAQGFLNEIGFRISDPVMKEKVLLVLS
jgi:Fe-S cluster assembly protein SufD